MAKTRGRLRQQIHKRESEQRHQGEMAESNLSDERQEAKQNMNEMKDCQNKSRNKTQTMVPRQLNTGKR